VTAYAPHLLGTWAAGALLQAYAVRGVAPLLVGLAAGTGWAVWEVGERSGTATAVALALLALGLLATSAGVLHGRVGPPRFAAPWRTAGAVLTLGGLFVAALPTGDDGPGRQWALLAAAAAVAAAVAAAAAPDLLGRLEVAAAGAALALGLARRALAATGSDVVGCADRPGAAARRRRGRGLPARRAVDGRARRPARRAAHDRARDRRAGAVHGGAELRRLRPRPVGRDLFLALGAVLALSGWVADRGPPRARDDRAGGGGMTALRSPSVRLAVACLLSAVLVGLAVWPQLSARLTGETYDLAVAPLDPIDPFRART
jgi:hypothetical protein